MNDSVRNMVIASIVLVLAAMYGGDTLGSWFHWQKEVDFNDDGMTEETIIEFYLEGMQWESEFESGDSDFNEDSEEDGDPDYDDNECAGTSDCDEMHDLMQGKILNLLYVIIIAGGAALYFINDGDQEKAALACLAMGGAGLLAAGLFVLSFPEAFHDDTDAFESDIDDFDEDPSIFGDDSQTTDDENFYYGENVDIDRSWRPGIAFLLVALSGLIGMAAYAELKT